MAKPVAKAKANRPVERDVKLTCVGMQYRVKKDARRMMKAHIPFQVTIKRERTNKADENALAIFVTAGIPYKGTKLGYLKREVAEVWSPLIDSRKLRIKHADVIGIDADRGEADLLITVSVQGKSLETSMKFKKQRKRLDKFV